MNLGIRLALAFAVVTALVAATVATIGFQFIAGRVTDEVQRTRASNPEVASHRRAAASLTGFRTAS